MKGIKLKTVHIGRKGAVLGASVAVVGLSLLGGAAAHAAIGTDPGSLSLSPASGALTLSPTWSTSDACPAGEGFGTLEMQYSDSTASNPDYNTIGAQSLPAGSPINAATLVAGDSIGTLESQAGWVTGQTAEIVVLCSSGTGGTGTKTSFNQSIFITFGATNYTTSATGPKGPATPIVTLSATPNPVQVGANVTLTATVALAGTPVTAGAVQFESGGTTVGTPVALSSSGVATTTTTFTSPATDALTAVFQTSDATNFNDATSNTVSENVSANNPNSTGELITVSVAPSGSFTFTGTTNATAALTESGLTATGALVPVTVTDTRTGLSPNASVPSLVNGFNGFPGWSVVGQATDFSDPTSQPVGDIPVANFNWTPTTPAAGDFTLGGATTTGLGTAQTLAAALAGHGDGTFNLGANLSLAIPSAAPAGAYSSTLTLTANPTANFS
jgi:hypothetical protein